MNGVSLSNLCSCYVCNSEAELEEHHIIPRCYGGENGPTVTLCATCHSLVHKLAQGVEVMIPPRVNLTRAAYFKDCILKAKRLTEEDPNKTTKFHTTFSGEVSKKLRDLVGSKKFGTSQKKVIENLIIKAHSSIFNRK